MIRKIILILIIAFIKVGPLQAIPINNAFFCLLICLFYFWLEIKYQPFITKELNSFNLKAIFLMSFAIFLGLFISVCQEATLQIILLAIILTLNVWFLLIALKNYLILQIGTSNNKKIEKIKKVLEKFWSKGNIFSIFFRFSIFYS